MSFSAVTSRISRLRKQLSEQKEVQVALEVFAHFLGREFDAEIVRISYPPDLFYAAAFQFDVRGSAIVSLESTDSLSPHPIEQGKILFGDQGVPLPIYISDFSRARAGKATVNYARAQGVVSLAIVPFYRLGQEHGYIELQYRTRFRRWTQEDTLMLEQCADLCALALERMSVGSQIESTAISSSTDDTLLESMFSDLGLGLVKFNSERRITFLNQSAEKLLVQAESGIRTIDDLLELILDYRDYPSAREAVASLYTLETQRSELVLNGKSSSNGHAGVQYRLSFNSGLPEKDEVLLAVQVKSVSSGYRRELEEARLEFERMAEYGNLVVIKTDRNFRITEIVGRTENLLGIGSKELLQHEDVWLQFVMPEDLRRLARRIRRMGGTPRELSEEIRVVNKQTSAITWLMLRAVPLYTRSNEFAGWEGFGVDVTRRLRAQQELHHQSRRVEALYEVSRALEVTMDPALVALKGLRAIMRASSSDSGFACFYDSNTGTLEIVAAEGVSQHYLEEASKIVGGDSLVRYAVEHNEGLLIGNIQKDDRSAREVAKIEDLKSTIVMPVTSEGEVLGAILVSCRAANQYSDADFDLVHAAANQIGLVARQAEFYASEKRQADSVAVLYRLSHELSKLFDPREVAEHAFPIIQQELACKRMWLGVLNERGTHIVGQGGFGPGIRRHIKEMQIELGLRHDFLDEALSSKQPVIVRRGQEMECSGLNRLVNRLSLGDFIIVPLVALGQVVGVFLVEPSVSSAVFVQRKLSLLTRMANEIAIIILTRRFETKMADADKMRVAGMLASGVAHNFNNLLQAVIGQASLIEMQIPEDSPLVESARTIVDAAGRGASLIKQLLSFSLQNGLERQRLSVTQILGELRELYESIAGSAVKLEIDLDPDSPPIIGDAGQIQQIIMNLVMNAKEAVGTKPEGSVRIHTSRVRVRSGEVDPELPPGSYLRIDVEDNGIGMDAERQSRCFEPFFTTKDVDRNTGIGLGGAGLGLSSAYSITRQHGGVITVSSTIGEGSVFSVFLPTDEELQGETANDLSSDGDQLPVLILDLEDSVAFSVRSTLHSLGLGSEIVNDQSVILERVSTGSDVKLIIVDVDRFGDGIIDFFSQIMASNATIKIVVSTIDRLKWVSRLSQFQGVSVVEKPLGVWAIHSVVRELLPIAAGPNLRSKVEVERPSNSQGSGVADISPEEDGKRLRKEY